MNEMDLERMLEDVTSVIANPACPQGLQARLKAAAFASDAAASVMAVEPLRFGSLQAASGGSRNTWVSAAMLHAAVLLLVFFEMRAMHNRAEAPTSSSYQVMLSVPPPPLMPPKNSAAAAGGGGHAGPAPATAGTPPRFAAQPLAAVALPPMQQPKLVIESSVAVLDDLRMAKSETPQLGMPTSPLIGMSLGHGRGEGLGDGGGSGLGAGLNGGTGGGVMHVGGGVMKPEVLFAPLPEFSEEARKAKVSGNVLVYLQVDPHGRATHVRVLRGIGLGLDEKAVDAVRQYRFKPATLNGQPVTVEMQVEVNFQIL